MILLSKTILPYLGGICLFFCLVDLKHAEKSIQDEMVEDMMALIASFSGKLYGMSSKAKKQAKELID